MNAGGQESQESQEGKEEGEVGSVTGRVGGSNPNGRLLPTRNVSWASISIDFKRIVVRNSSTPAKPVTVLYFNRGRIVGVSTPGSKIEFINLSRLPSARLNPEDTTTVGTASSDGRYRGLVKAKPGDLIRLRARGPHGVVSAWTTVRLRGRTLQRPVVALDRIGLACDGRGNVQLFNLDTPRPISEPNVGLSFHNRRLPSETLIALSATGSFRGASFLPGGSWRCIRGFSRHSRRQEKEARRHYQSTEPKR